MAETSQETPTPTASTTASARKSERPSVLERLKSILSAIGKGAGSAEKMGIYHNPEPPQPKNPPMAEPSKP